jgi:hypothetical protein
VHRVAGQSVRPSGDAGAGEGEQNWETATYAYPAATVVDCAGPHAGEVISVDYGADAPTAATLPQLDDGDATCQHRVDSIAKDRGLGQIIDRRGVAGTIAWKPALDLSGRLVGPDDSARHRGERWSGCAMVSEADVVGAPGGPLPGQCLVTADITDLSSFGVAGGVVQPPPEIAVSCSVPHPAQLVAYAAMVGGAPTGEDTLESCVAAVRQFTGMTAADLDQGLVVTTVGVDYPFCVVVASDNRKLGESLLGLGDRPVPFVG